MKTREEKIIELGVKMCQGHLKITPESAEYRMLDLVLTDEELDVLSVFDIYKPLPVPAIVQLTGKSPEDVQRVMDSVAEKFVVVDAAVPGYDGFFYKLPVFAPGLFEFQMLRTDWLDNQPEAAILFKEHTVDSYNDVAPTMPMGVGIMRVVPIETSLPAETETVSMERLSALLDTVPGGLFSLSPCQCRRVRRMMGEATEDFEDNMCVFAGALAGAMIRHGRGKQLTKEEVLEHIKRTEEMGCMHQITTLESGTISAVCNCKPSSCLAIGASQYFNTPNLSRSNYVSEIDAEKCVACGQCVEACINNALRLGQKACSKTPIVHIPTELPDEVEWGPERWNPDYRSNRKLVVETGTSPCKVTCPAHIAIQGYIKLAAQGKYMDALELIKKENPFPAVCGRICPHDCENECTRGEIDKPIAIDEIKKFIADREIQEENRFVPKRIFDHDKKIAVIGSGPAGLSCAYFLAADGYKVTVFEKAGRPGGMLMNGIPNFRLEKDVVEAEIEVLKALDVQFVCGCEVGKDVTIPQLREQGFEAFYLGIGLQDGGKLGIPGDDAECVMAGVDFVKAINSGNDIELTGKVVVIGGGNIGADVARTAVRHGAESVDLYCLESYDEMPMGEEDQELCKEDGVTIHAGWGQTEIFTQDGKCCGIKFRKCTSVKNEEGRFDPKFDDDVTETAECSTVLFCIGQKPDWGTLLTGVNVELDGRGLVVADPLTYQTSEPDIFAGGDVYTGQKFVIDAIAAGKQGAISINRAVWEGHSLTIGRIRNEYKALDKSDLDFEQISYDNTSRQVPGVAADKVRTKCDERLTFTEEQVQVETSRCLECGATIVDQNRCLGCGLCTTKCKFDAIHLIRKFDVPVRGLTERLEFMEEYRKERERKIEIKKVSKA